MALRLNYANQTAVETADTLRKDRHMALNGLTKAQTLDMIRNIDLIGMTLTMEQVTGKPTPANIQKSLIVLLGGVRDGLAQSYGINISAKEAIGFDSPSKHHLTPKETADEILRDLNSEDDGGW